MSYNINIQNTSEYYANPVMKGENFMRISTKVECGIIALVDIAVNSGNESSVNVVNISKRNGISAKYLEQILPMLRHAHIINSIKGAKGGYTLTRSPNKILLSEIMDAIDNTILGNTAVYYQNTVSETINEYVWTAMEDKLRELAENTTLSDIVDKYIEKAELNSGEPMYYI